MRADSGFSAIDGGTTDRQYVQNNAASRQRLRDLIARLDDEEM